jgi:hypothetical protein
MNNGDGNPVHPPPTVETCPYRRSGTDDASKGTATCDLVSLLLNEPAGDAASVSRDVCEACCRAFPPTTRDLNPVVASMVFTRATRLAESISDGPTSERLRRVGEVARERLDVLYVETHERPQVHNRARPRLSRLLPPPRVRVGQPVRDWAVGVTTSPRIHATLEACLDSLLHAGWEHPHLFIDGPVRVSDRHTSLPTTYRRERVGAWPNYFLALAELLLLRPRAEAFMVVQDDALFYEHESLPRYLEHVLWPAPWPCLVSLYCCGDDQAERPGWRAVPGLAVSGPLALVFPAELAKAFVTDFAVFEHRWQPDERAATSLGDLITIWANCEGIATWFPTPSLVQHIGDTSTLWPGAHASGARRAGRFAGDSGP